MSLDQPSWPVAFLPQFSVSDASALLESSLLSPWPGEVTPCQVPIVEPDLSMARDCERSPSTLCRSLALISVFSPALQTLGCCHSPLQNLGIPSSTQQGTWHTVGLGKRLLHCTLWLPALFSAIFPQSFHLSLTPPAWQEEYTPGTVKSDLVITR